MRDDRSARSESTNALDVPVQLVRHDGRTVFPRQPHWWKSSPPLPRDLLTEFNPADISMIVDDLTIRRRDPARTPETVAALLRRQWALTWLADVSRTALRIHPPDQSLEHHTRDWQARAAVNLAECTWAEITQLPSQLSDAAIRLALLDPGEPDD